MIEIDNTYLRLLERFLLEPIVNDEHLERALVIADDLAYRSAMGETCPAEEKYLSVLYCVIADYESKRFRSTELGPVELVKALMEFNSLSQADLAPLFGGASRVSEFLNGKRELSKEQIANLSKRFCLSPAAFFQTVPNSTVAFSGTKQPQISEQDDPRFRNKRAG